MTTEIFKPALVTERLARDYLGGISRAMLYHLRAEGLVKPVHLGRAVRYSLANLDEVIHTLQGSAEETKGS